MMTQKAFSRFQSKVRSSRQDPSFDKAEVVAMLSGPAPIIEIVVAQASANAKIPMDWGYCAGRAIIRAKGDKKIARRELFLCMPQSDLTQMDL